MSIDGCRYPPFTAWPEDLIEREAEWDDPPLPHFNRVPRAAIYAPAPIRRWKHKVEKIIFDALGILIIFALLYGALLLGGVE